MTDTDKLESLLGAGGEVRLGRREAQDVLQKLRARGAASESAARLEGELAHSDEVVELVDQYQYVHGFPEFTGGYRLLSPPKPPERPWTLGLRLRPALGLRGA